MDSDLITARIALWQDGKALNSIGQAVDASDSQYRTLGQGVIAATIHTDDEIARKLVVNGVQLLQALRKSALSAGAADVVNTLDHQTTMLSAGLNRWGGGQSTRYERPGSDSSAGRPEQVRAPASARPTQYPPSRASNPSPSQTRTAARDSQVPSQPNPLAQALQENHEARSRTALWLTTKAFDSGICRADVTVNFASGGQQAITTPGLSSRSGVELVSGRLMGVRYGTTVDKVPSDDELGTQGGLFFTEDYSKIAIVNDCSGPEDQAAFVDLRFPYLKEDGDDYMAEAGVSVYQGGQSGAAGATTMITGSTQNVDISVTGDWVAEDPEKE